MLIDEPEVRPSLIIYGDATEIVPGRVISKPEEDISQTDVIETDDDMGDEQAGSTASACPTKRNNNKSNDNFFTNYYKDNYRFISIFSAKMPLILRAGQQNPSLIFCG